MTQTELARLGMTSRQIKYRLDRGDLIRVFRGVYRVGHAAPSLDAHFLAAVRACGDGAVLFRRSAAYLLGLSRELPEEPEVLALHARRVPGVCLRRTGLIDPRDVTTVRELPVTTAPRTLVDLAAFLDEDELARACHAAWVRYRVGAPRIDQVLRRNTRAKGRRKLVPVIGGEVQVTLSKLEQCFLELLRDAGLPLPLTNKLVDSHLVDCRWQDHALTVELDSYRFHNTQYSWQRGYERERAAYARKDAFRRYTWRDVFEDPTRMLAELRELLTGPSPTRR
ncbi:MAG: type IV toxin-antitoxin system AbiEi family antitoxin domain-containing protein [Actinobacteria bacterium]|nr:type IV toxin-antitoxin system AbiEi family antitoxin domain-containing protein [Actinomycetota bacterium]